MSFKLKKLNLNQKLNKSDLVRNYRQFILDFGCGFHPDNNSDEYVTLSKSDSKYYDNALSIFWAQIPEQIYEIGGLVLEFELDM